MARPYEHARSLAEEISARRQKMALSYEQLGVLADVDGSQVFRICRGDFKTLNPSVLKICNVLGIQPKADGVALRPSGDDEVAAMLCAEVLAAWDRTEAGARRLKKVLRALSD